MPMPARATPIGRPMASTDPKARMRMTMAKARPSSSEDGGLKSPNALPPNSIRSPWTVGWRSSTWRPTALASLTLWSLGSSSRA